MTDRIEPHGSAVLRGLVPDAEQVVCDPGQRWCVNAAAHPDRRDGFLDHGLHLPGHECRSREAYVDDVRRDLRGGPVGMSVYLAAPFRVRHARGAAPARPRVVIESWLADADKPAQRISLNPAEALRLARILVGLADELIFTGCAG